MSENHPEIIDTPCLADVQSVEPTEEELAAIQSAPEASTEATGFRVRTDIRSANYGPNPMVAKPTGIMLHHTAGRESGDIPTLTRAGTGVSSSDYINKQGVIYELVPHPRRAWHAGTRDASQAGRYYYDGNTNYWGVEIENYGNNTDPYPKAQVDAIIWRCRRLKERFGLYDPSQIFRHRDFAPSRKSDTSNNFPFLEVQRRIMAKTDVVDGGSTPAPPTPPTGALWYRVKVSEQQISAMREERGAKDLVAKLKGLGVTSAKYTAGP